MATRPEYLTFTEAESPSKKTRVVMVKSFSSSVLLGHIAWYGPWRQYTFYPEHETIWNKDCMRQLAERLEQMTTDHRLANAKRKPVKQ